MSPDEWESFAARTAYNETNRHFSKSATGATDLPLDAASEIESPQPPAMFRIASETAESRIAALKKNESDRLKLAVFYAKEGMLDSAACTLKEILAKIPKHKAARRLQMQVEQWKKENRATVQRCGPSTVTKGRPVKRMIIRRGTLQGIELRRSQRIPRCLSVSIQSAVKIQHQTGGRFFLNRPLRGGDASTT